MKQKEQFGKIAFFPMVTTSRNELIEYIKMISEWHTLNTHKTKGWIKRIESELCEAHYFIGLIFVERISFYLVLHELIHHISALMRGYTQSKIWYNLDYLIDGLDIFLFRK